MGNGSHGVLLAARLGPHHHPADGDRNRGCPRPPRFNLSAGQTANLPTDYWVSYSTDGGATFGNEQHIVGSFDQLTAPFARGFFLGDYEGLQPSGGGFQALFVKTNCNALDASGQVFPSGGLCAPASSNLTPTSNTRPTDVFTARLTP